MCVVIILHIDSNLNTFLEIPFKSDSDESHPDWAPTQKIGSKNLLSKSALERYNRRKKFQVLKGKCHAF